jgi:hypothetical protein
MYILDKTEDYQAIIYRERQDSSALMDSAIENKEK